VIFRANSAIKTISGFDKCDSLGRIEIPPSVHIVGALNKCKSQEVIFEVESNVTMINGFNESESHCRIEFPRWVNYILGFNNCYSLCDVLMKVVSCVVHTFGFENTHPFILSSFQMK
jgi:hypothetical protein